MTAGRGTPSGGVAGGLTRHVPVLLEEAIGFLAPAAGGTFIDGTFGAGGYTSAILATGASVIAIDRDPDAIAGGIALQDASGGRLTLSRVASRRWMKSPARTAARASMASCST